MLASRKAADAEVRRLQQQAETEQGVELFAHRRYSRRCVAGADDGASLAMYPLVAFVSQARGYVNNGRRFLSDAPSARLFSTFWPAASRRSVEGFFLQFPFRFSLRKRPLRSISRTADFGRLVAIPFRG